MAAQRSYGDEVVVLRTTQLGEADRILTLFGRERGKIRAVARGVRRTTSKMGGRLEPFAVVDAQLYSKNPEDRSRLETVTQAVTVESFTEAIIADFERYAAASAMAESVDEIIDAEPAPLQYALLIQGLRSLAGAERDPLLELGSYLLRSLSLAGWEPSFNECARCGEPGPHARVSFAAGGAVCASCGPSSGATTAAHIDTMRLLWALLAGNWRVALASDAETRADASRIVKAYTNYHLDRPLRSFAAVDEAWRMRGAAGT
ncbi:DNA repair protein RecO [Gulosibacter chungangensis]|uniref:DNA repair protein RecO n=1 Tax=Gulosibacter chungangensis TaxID=979746 RepID=A0A7J5BBZ8_9MICO|nr:DNA repair protein RecO [Gulosibacter chungangensis]KAB1643636.1 DNA repair protein RecO [Gulosibacter chungangensis]